MAKLHFFYSTMNAGKSTALLQSNHNYLESNLKTMLFVPKEIAKKTNGKIVSRIGLEADAIVTDAEYEFFKEVKKTSYKNISCIFVDEVQFLTKQQIRDLSKISDELNIPVMCYGIRTDFQGDQKHIMLFGKNVSTRLLKPKIEFYLILVLNPILF